ncbi:MAG TPA: nitrogenase cofactor biosynthesis protein NifB [Syntrophomonas sp.]|jgi:nitrogen fixation protein NifB|nr:nitrogenase cofactor biosynthesis protein NifB [Syntrophomonas sp.]
MKCTCTSKYRIEHDPQRSDEKTRQHPCFSTEAHRQYGRIHLPVAPACNLSCNYCNRRFDCNNESRPGVASALLTPEEACRLYVRVRSRHDNIKVVGIAGPGDALANWPATRQTIGMIKEMIPDTIFCLSTNGLKLLKCADALLELGVKHITVTVNSLKAAIGARIYQQVWFEGRRYDGAEGARLLIRNQLEAIQYLAGRGAVIKVNTVMIPGINDRHIPDIVKAVGARGAFISNIMPLIPAPGSVFENASPTGVHELHAMRQRCASDLQQMYHCRQCRADAIGLLGKDLVMDGAGGELCPVKAIKKVI